MEGKVALITGSSSGIGAGIAQRFAELGCSLALTGRDAGKLKDVETSCRQCGLSEKKILLVPGDLTEDEDIDRIFSETIGKFGRLDILVRIHNTLSCVVNMSSVASKTTCDYNPTYSISKVALDQFTKSLAVELGPFGVRVNSLNPGVILTPLYRHLGKTDEQLITWSKSMLPIGRHGTVDEVVKATEYLISDDARCVTGMLLSIDGGRFLM
ncbi:3-oxoacyl-[acyl-carrier-protein] reductase FabG-like [Lytechinus pictus]|uniref:3-oxoacyl-[acyl-carrier-protein] reductase FabG-like n=1 Tax=Lytechinus pictus TaxID=7653 RepID=UPI0030B9D5F9